MNLNLFSLFKQNTSELIVPDSILVKQIKSLAKNSNLKVLSNTDIYLHAKRSPIELMLYDELRGIYLFEIKKWSFDDMKNATIQKAQNQEHSNNTLAFDKTQEMIKRKLDEIVHNNDVKIINYLLMENLSADEYEHLDDSFKELLPKEKIIFNDSSTSDIFKKLQSEPITSNANDILEILFTQYTKLKDNGTRTLCSDQEIEFLDTPLNDIAYLFTEFQNDKNVLLILKALIEVFSQKSEKVVLIKHSILARDIAYKKLLDILEYGIVEIDMNAIEFLTPLELVNKHLQKLKKQTVSDLSEFDIKLLSKKFDIAGLVICDDAQLLDAQFIEYIKNIQKNKKSLFVNLEQEDDTLQHFDLSSIQLPQLHFLMTNPLAKCMQLLQKLLKSDSPENILVVSNPQNRDKLHTDLQHFLDEELSLVDATQRLLQQNLIKLKLTTYDDIFELSTKHIILLDLCEYNEKQIEYAFNLATENAYILYDTPCEIVEQLKEKYESQQE